MIISIIQALPRSLCSAIYTIKYKCTALSQESSIKENYNDYIERGKDRAENMDAFFQGVNYYSLS